MQPRRCECATRCISDIHANLPALEAVLADIDAPRDVDAIYHLGDLVGYAPWPNEIVALHRALAASPASPGNYDSTVATDYKHCGCRYEDPRQEELSHLSYDWTRRARVAGDEGVPGRTAVPDRPAAERRAPRRAAPGPGPRHADAQHVYWTEDRPDEFCLKMASHAG